VIMGLQNSMEEKQVEIYVKHINETLEKPKKEAEILLQKLASSFGFQVCAFCKIY
jgi:hypothetical protein